MPDFEIMDDKTMKTLKERLEYIEVNPEKLVFVGEPKQLGNPMFTEKQWTKILTKGIKGIKENE